MLAECTRIYVVRQKIFQGEHVMRHPLVVMGRSHRLQISKTSVCTTAMKTVFAKLLVVVTNLPIV